MALKYQVGLRVRDLRNATGMTQDQLAAQMEMSPQTVKQIERGASAPKFNTIEALSKALNAPPSLMFPHTVSGRRETAKDKLISAIMANAVQLTKDDAETVLALAANLNKRKR